MNRKTYAALIVLSLAASACASGERSRYPSLAMRDVERAQGQFEVGETKTLAVPPVETGLTGPLPERLAALVLQGRSAHKAFTAAQGGAARLAEAAGGAAVGSDSWASAQVALADLDSARSEAAMALAELDILYVAATVEAQDTAAIAAARDEVTALVAEEDAVLERLRARVR